MGWNEEKILYKQKYLPFHLIYWYLILMLGAKMKVVS